MGNTSSDAYCSSTKAESVCLDANLSGKVVIVTGANTGIGKETARVLALRGAHVVMACRSRARGEKTVADLVAKTGKEGAFEVLELDLNSQASVRQFADAFRAKHEQLHLLINNAGIMALERYTTTADGFEAQWGVNHLGHFALTQLLLPALIAGAPSRIVNLSSRAHTMAPPWGSFPLPPVRDGYSGWRNYGISKASNILFTKGLHARCAAHGVTSFAVHPGVIKTELHRNNAGARFFYTIGSVFMKSVPQGAATTVYCALQPGIEGQSGSYFADCALKPHREDLGEQRFADELWQLSERLVAEAAGGAAAGAAGEAPGGETAAPAAAAE